MHIKAKLEALIYAAEEPITLDQMAALLRDDLLALKTASETAAEAETQSEQAIALSEAAEAPVEGPAEPMPDASGAVRSRGKDKKDKSEKAELRALLKPILEDLVTDYAKEDRGIEVREVASGFRMYTKPEHHDVVRAFSKSLK